MHTFDNDNEETDMATKTTAATISVMEVKRGALEVLVRSQFVNPARRTRLLEQVYGRRYPGAEVRKAEFSDLKDLGIPVRIELEVFAPKLLSDEDGG